MKNKILKLITLALILISVPTGIAHADDGPLNFTCELLNNQDALANCTPDQEELCKQSLAGKIVIITEEPLGPADGKFTHRCARKTVCAPLEQESNEPASVDDNSDTAATDSNTTKKISKLKCNTLYTTPDQCKVDGTPASNEAYTTCEYIMAYVADDGPSLLYGYIGHIYRYVAGIAGLIAVFILIAGGTMIAAAGGDSERVSKAKTLITRSLIGLVVLFLTALILYTINPNFFTL